jgi:hypothetical protein
MRLFLAFASIVALASLAVADEKPVEIPLKEVWAANMPDTRSVSELEPGEAFGKSRHKFGPMTRDIFDALHMRKYVDNDGKITKPAGPGFAVSGSGIEALRNAHAVFTGKAKPAHVTGDATLVFYSISWGVYVHLGEIERNGKEVTVGFHFVKHPTLMPSTHFALIPVGKLPVGKYRVNIEQEKSVHPYSADLAQRIVCKSFEFEVK